MTKPLENNNNKTQNKSAKNLRKNITDIVFIDPRVANYQSLRDGVKTGSEVITLDPTKDGVKQISEFLAGLKSKSVNSIHIVSHGSEGSLQLGSTYLNTDNLNSYANQLKKWAKTLTNDADILLYGCDVASGKGTEFVKQLSQITGADVAASTDTTGSAILGGDWDLEAKMGKIETSLAFKSEVIQAYNSVLASAGDVIINEFSQGSAGAREWVELLVVTDNLNLQGHKLVDGNNTLSITLSGSGFSSLKAGTLIVLYNGGNVDGTIIPDLTYSPSTGDYVLQISSLNSNGVFSVTRNTGWNAGTGAFTSGSTTDVPRLLNSSGTEIYRFPRTPTPIAGRFSAYTGNSATGATSSGNWSADALSTSATPGSGNGVNNITWINSLLGLTVNFGAATYNTTEGSTATTFTIPVTLGATPGTSVTVPIIIKNSSTATQSTDYTLTPSTLTFAAGATGASLTRQITFTIQADDLPENAETVVLNFGTLTGAVAGTITETTLNIAANDSIQYAVTTTSSSLTEGNSGTQTVTFTVTRSGGIGVASTVDYALGGTATFGSDYNNIKVTSGGTASSGTLNFAVGENIKTITVDVLGDNTFELDENITVTLSNPNLTTAPANSTISTSAATVNITNDETPPTISISDTSVTEGNTGTTDASFTVTLSNPSYQQVTVNYSTSDGTATTADSDYIAKNGTITFAPGQTTQTIDVAVIGDNKFEANETFNVNLFVAINSTIAKAQGVATIANDDTLPTIIISDTSLFEGNIGPSNATFTVTLSKSSSQQVTVDYVTSDGTATTADSDYTSGSGTITFNPGETSKTINIAVIGDNKFEPNETFNVNLSSATNSTIADSLGVVTITNDDSQATISISDISSVTEGNTGTKNATFTVTLSNPSYQPVTVNYSTSDGTATTADSDYTAKNGTITFAPGQISQTIDVAVIGDNTVETDETFFVNLFGETNAGITKGQGIATIINDDNSQLPAISISDASVTEGNTGTKNASLTITLSKPSSQQVTVDYATSDGTATTANSDYTAKNGTITFAPGDISKVIDIFVIGDNKFEANETFLVNLSGETNSTITDSLGVATIINDDINPLPNQIPKISISDVSLYEGNDIVITNGNFNVTLSNSSNQQVIVNYSTNSGTTDFNDFWFSPGLGTLIFNPGEIMKTISFGIRGDNNVEGNEKFYIDLFGVVNADVLKGRGVGTILNDDMGSPF